MSVKKEYYILPNDTPIVKLDCDEAFKNLTGQEKKYVHHLARASAEGILISFIQESPESPALFAIFHQLFSHETIEEVKHRALSSGWNDDEVTALFVYSAAIYTNTGNYKYFGDTKYIPGVDKDKFSNLLKESKAFAKNSRLQDVWKKVEDRVFSLDQKYLAMNFYDQGVTTYHSPTVTQEDSALVDKYFKSKNMEQWNTRLFKSDENGKIVYTIRLAAIKDSKISEEEFNGAKFIIHAGDYSPLLEKVNKELSQAITATTNDKQKQMLQKYMEHFESGSMDAHKDGSRIWIRDINPVVETYIGFILNYRDPAGSRGEFSGYVAAVNKETSKKFQTLVDKAETFLQRLPWGPDYEKDKFSKPDFSSLDVIFYGGNCLPSGLNMPNYNEIRQNDGFKNFTLGNVIAAMPKLKMEFISVDDETLYKKYFKESWELQVGLHELLGHGSGKLFIYDGEKFNFDKEKVKNYSTGGKIESWYDKGESCFSRFGALYNPYEECRSEAVGYFLCCYSDILQIFGFDGQLADDIKYVNWSRGIRAGLLALEFYQPEAKKWGQAHSWARFVLFRVAMGAGQGFVTLEECTDENGKPDLKFRLDRSKIDSIGKPAIGEFLKLLQLYKSTGDVANGSDLFNKWGAVHEEQLRWRNTVISRRKPHRLFVQSNTSISNDKVELKTYPETFAGVIQSYVDRHNDGSVDTLLNVWEKENKIFGL